MDKNEIASAFRIRLKSLLAKRGESISAFARRCGLDRSAISQFLDGKVLRLPRAETLAAIATAEGTSIDWLLGISQDEESLGEVTSLLGVEIGDFGTHDSPLEQWHREAAGYKIRYVPSSLPDLLRTKAVTEYQFGSVQTKYADLKVDIAQRQLDYNRLPETDMEVALPLQRLHNLASGCDIWDGLARGARQAQLEQIAHLCEELYPTFRMFLYDANTHFTVPFTVFGPKRAAVYMGEMYLVLNAVEHIREMTRRFDNLIRVAEITADRIPEWVRGLKVV